MVWYVKRQSSHLRESFACALRVKIRATLHYFSVVLCVVRGTHYNTFQMLCNTFSSVNVCHAYIFQAGMLCRLDSVTKHSLQLKTSLLDTICRHCSHTRCTTAPSTRHRHRLVCWLLFIVCCVLHGAISRDTAFCSAANCALLPWLSLDDFMTVIRCFDKLTE